MSLKSFIFPVVLEEKKSKYNAKIQVREFFGRRSLVVNGITQSGSIVEDIYKKIIPRIPIADNTTDQLRILILGFGTGTFAKLINKFVPCGINKKYPQAKIIGIEIDKTIIELGKKYFDTDKISNLKLINKDAIKFVNNYFMDSRVKPEDDKVGKFDIIFVDLYRGEQIESQVENPAFLERITEMLNKNGIVIFNRLNFSSHKDKAQNFKELLEKIFSQVTAVKSYSNIIFLSKK